ncbi:DnaJ-domain-containing protein [Coniophora puteana RWD-64-598 SS2]|uniref:DnaJ-domain-containing protein n=1 Tax=Coniophora puteana (strain RWD-64-598) TaxID=741705 RepID=A0A5M3ME70_CONPW|nr:DnaJ-domain-containing protein [Coniophora puteana RWD-64-598 SS2]EIW77306.1 DnaJ-domain-containing protein [Coniophora puteana RWD-64-598 SS2]
MSTFARAITRQFSAARPARTTLFRPARIPHVATYHGQWYDSRPEQPPPLEVERVVTPCLYDVLNVPRDATKEQIKEQYRKLMWKYHPDVAGGQRNPQMFQIVTDAYDALLDDNWRARYDADLALFEKVLNDGITRVAHDITQRSLDRIRNEVAHLGGKMNMNDLVLAQRAIGDWLEATDVIPIATKEWLHRKYPAVKGKEPQNPGLYAFPPAWAHALENPWQNERLMKTVLDNIMRRFDDETWDRVTRDPASGYMYPLPSESWCRAVGLPEKELSNFSMMAKLVADPSVLDSLRHDREVTLEEYPDSIDWDVLQSENYRRLRTGSRAGSSNEEVPKGEGKVSIKFMVSSVIWLAMGAAGLATVGGLWAGYKFVYKPLKVRIKKALGDETLEDAMVDGATPIEEERREETPTQLSS